MKKNLLLLMFLALMFACFSCKSKAKTEEPAATEETMEETTTPPADTAVMETADTTMAEETME